MVSRAARAVAGSLSKTKRARPDCTEMTAMWWATTSWSSRAILPRSYATSRRARSSCSAASARVSSVALRESAPNHHSTAGKTSAWPAAAAS
ncbi:hypothetical protein ACFY40_25180 [Streptomyces sp. NPDC012950]|uniref:hypothetical protein n=1 Tax=Streptomyces sp. NPDC012950 TaxID=3364858 RepID=UPI0036BAFD41